MRFNGKAMTVFAQFDTTGGDSTSIIAVDAITFDDLVATNSLVVGNLYLITETDDNGIAIGYNKGDIFLATYTDRYEWRMNIMGEDGKDGTQIIPITGNDLDSLVYEASNGELALVIGTLYLTTSDTNESGNAFVNAPAGTLFLVTGVDTVEEQVRIKGADYVLTAADKEEIVQSVLDALPIYGGETEEVAANE